MRYWIWWNDLVQGPFEIQELSVLQALSEELLVCMEERTDWLPAGRVADLAPIVESRRSRQSLNSVLPPPAPPPPPKRPPRMVPLQGELFNDPPGQEFLFGMASDSPGGFAFTAADQAMDVAALEYPIPSVTMPIRLPIAAVFGVKEESSAAVAQDLFTETEPPASVPLEVVEPAPPPTPVTAPEHEPVREPEPEPRFTLPETAPWEEPRRRAPAAWLPWLGASMLMLGLVGFAAYWMMDLSTSREAIRVAKAAPIKPIKVTPPAKSNVVPVQPKPVAKPKPAPVIKKPKPAAVKPPASLPGLAAAPAPAAAPASTPTPTPSPAPVPTPPLAPAAATPPLPGKPDPWRDRQNEAITRVMKHKIINNKVTLADHARAMLNQMHDKELLQAVETGERLYLPDKMSWTALREEGPLYRVYLNFSALRASGERAQTRSYQFSMDLKSGRLTSDDTAAQQDFLRATQPLSAVRPALAVDLDNLLSGVDALNKQKLRNMVVSRNRRNKDEIKNIEKSIEAAAGKVKKSIAFFRTRYPEKSLQNAAKAYGFMELLQ